MDPTAAARAVQDPAARLLHDHGVDQHDGQGRVPRPVDVRDDGPGDGDRPRRPRARDRPDRAPAPEPARRRQTSRSPRPSGNVFHEITPLETLEQALDDARLRRVPRRAGRGPGRGPAARARLLRLRRADVDGRADAGDRRRDGASRGEREGDRLPRHDVARPERRDDDGADRRRHTRRRLRRRDGRAGRHQSTPYGPGTGGSRAPRSSPAVRPAKRARWCATRSSRSPPTAWRRRPRTSTIVDGSVFVRGHTGPVVTMREVADRGLPASPSSCRPSSAPGWRRRSGSGRPASPPGRTRRTCASSRSTATRAYRRCCATSSRRTADG